MEYITGKQAQLILNITTRQGLHKVSKEHNIKIKSQGAGKPNLYLKSDVEEVAARTNKKRVKQNPELKEKVAKKKEIIEKNKNEIEVIKGKTKLDLQKEDFSPLNEIGQEEFLRVEKLLRENGTYEEIDRSLLLFYAISYQKYINAVIMSAQQDDTTMDDIGNLRVHPYFQVADRCFTHMQKLATMLGIGVRSRIGININKKKKESVFNILKSKEDF